MILALIYNTDLDLLVQGSTGVAMTLPVNGLILRRGNPVAATIQFVNLASNGPYDPGASASLTIELTLKTRTQYNQNPPLLLISSWTKTGIGATALWSNTFAVTSSSIISAFLPWGDSGQSPPSIETMVAVDYAVGTGATAESAPIWGTLQNTVLQSGSIAPTPAGQVLPWAFITAYVGNLATTLDGQSTSGLLNSYVITSIGGATQLWQVLSLGTGSATTQVNGYYSIVVGTNTAQNGLAFSRIS